MENEEKSFRITEYQNEALIDYFIILHSIKQSNLGGLDMGDKIAAACIFLAQTLESIDFFRKDENK